MTEIIPENEELDEPPILGSWQRMYITVLVLHVIVITLFYLFSQAYS